MTEKIDQLLNLEDNIPVVYEGESKNLIKLEDAEQVKDDLESAREGLIEAMAKSKSAVEDMVSIAQQSQHPKAYEVLNSAIKTLADVAMDLAELQLKKQKLTGTAKEPPSTVNNNMFVGSTAELQKILEDMRAQNG